MATVSLAQSLARSELARRLVRTTLSDRRLITAETYTMIDSPGDQTKGFRGAHDVVRTARPAPARARMTPAESSDISRS